MGTNSTIYLVTVSHPAGAFMPERDVADLGRAETIKDIATGQFERLSKVVECDESAGTCRDVTKDIAREVMQVWANEGDFLYDWQHDFVSDFVSPQAAASFRREAA